MSFDTKVKNEILKQRYPRKDEVISFLSGMVHTSSQIVSENGKFGLEICSDFDAVMRAKSAFAFVFADFPETDDPLTYEEDEKVVLKLQGDNILQMLEILQIVDGYSIVQGLPNFGKEEKLKKAYVAGCYIGGGKIVVPSKRSKNYLVEFTFTYEDTADAFSELLQTFGIHLSKKVRKERTLLQGRNTEEVSDVLSLMGAMDNFFYFQDILFKRTQNANINRATNCDIANEDRTAIASVQQVLAIQNLIEHDKLDELDENLKEIADLRLEFPQVSLEELGKMLNPQLGKSGVNHRMRKIKLISQKFSAPKKQNKHLRNNIDKMK